MKPVLVLIALVLLAVISWSANAGMVTVDFVDPTRSTDTNVTGMISTHAESMGSYRAPTVSGEAG